jgi:predicted small lipoprotein YifL
LFANPVVKCAALAVLLAATSLAGCGRRGDLEPAPESGLSVKEGREQARQGQPAQPIGAPAAPRSNGIVKPKEPFILDPIL